MTYHRLRVPAAEVTRVTLEVRSQGKLGGQAHVPDAEGVWFKLVRNVSCLISPRFVNLTRGILGNIVICLSDNVHHSCAICIQVLSTLWLTSYPHSHQR